MRLQLDQHGKIKTYIHIAQTAVLFLAWVLTIALLTRSGTTDGRVGWYFGLVRIAVNTPPSLHTGLVIEQFDPEQKKTNDKPSDGSAGSRSPF